MGHFDGRVVVITGAGRGLGRGLSEGFLQDGASVVGFGRSEDSLRELERQAGGERFECVVGDVGNPHDVERLFEAARARFGKVDVLVNNAALYPRTRFLETRIEDWAEVMRVNVVGMAHCCRLALPGMIAARHGRILNVGSFAWRGPIPGASSYSASKAAVTALTRAIASEVDPALDVLVNEFVPGIVRSGMSPEGLEPAAVYPHLRRVVSLPAGSPHGVVYLQGEVWEEHVRLRQRLARRLKGLFRGGRA